MFDSNLSVYSVIIFCLIAASSKKDLILGLTAGFVIFIKLVYFEKVNGTIIKTW